MNRQDVLNSLRQSPEVDVLIIGGGVNGIGTFRDLALQGVRVLLVDRADFCNGASAASSHMLHGGIRYLENGEFRLVREALHERNLLLKNAPHYARPLPTTIPIFRWFSGLFNAPLKFAGWLNKPGERGAVVIKLGLMMYDAFTGPQQSMPYHKVRGHDSSLREFPQLNPDLVCTATYYDAMMQSPERLCIEMMMDAEESSDKAHAVNYLGAVAGQGDTVTLKDELTGETYTVKPKVVINAAGPWIDFVNQAMNRSSHMIGGTKGSHIILDHPELYAATGGSEIFFENKDGRIVLIFPYLGKVMIGTTDIRIDNPDEAVCTEEEVDYMLELVSRVFPNIKVDRSQIKFRFCGVRPLPSSDASRTGSISRDHSIQTTPPGDKLNFPVHSLVGGKWTTFRAFSEQTADTVLKDLGQRRRVSTESLAIGGGANYPADEGAKMLWLKNLQQKTELTQDVLQALLLRYGTYAAKMAEYIGAGNDVTLRYAYGYTQREIEFIAMNEKVESTSDILLRRSLLGMLGGVNADVIREVADILGKTRGWTDEQIQADITRTEAVFREKHAMI